MAALFNLARMTVASSGTGDITLSNAVQGFLTFDLAGCSTASTGQPITYAINDTINSEIGDGVYYSSSLRVTRSPADSTNGGAAIDMSNAAQVFITPQAADLYPVPVGSGGTGTLTQQSSGRVLITTTSGVYTTDAALTYASSQLGAPSLSISSAITAQSVAATSAISAVSVSASSNVTGVSVTASSNMLAGAGSESAPSIGVGSSQSGFFRPAASQIGLSLGGLIHSLYSDGSSSPQVAYGSTSLSNNTHIELGGTGINSGGANSYGYADVRTQPAVTTAMSYRAAPTISSGQTVTSYVGFDANPSLGSGSVVNNTFGFRALNAGAVGSSANYGYYTTINGTLNYSFYAGGTAKSYFEGAVQGASQVYAALGVTAPAGGSSLAGVFIGDTNTSSAFGLFFGTGVPTLQAAQGSLYLRGGSFNGNQQTRLYVASSIGWVNLQASS